MALADQQCVPCRGGVPPLASQRIVELLGQLEPGWESVRDHHLRKTHKLRDFKSALAFIDRIGAMAEEQGHHSDLQLTWGKALVEIWTHKIDGLTESDFIFGSACGMPASRLRPVTECRFPGIVRDDRLYFTIR